METAVTVAEPESDGPVARAPGPSTLDGLPVRALAIVTESRGEVIVWQVNMAGSPSGAWVHSADDPATPLRVLWQCDRRALLSPGGNAVVELVAQLAKAAKADVAQSTLEARLCTVPDLLEATAEARATYEMLLRKDAEAHERRYAPLEWGTPVPCPIPNHQEALTAAASIRTFEDPTVGDALNLAYLTKWAIGLWRDTERTRSRRRNLRERYGPQQPLPADWRTRITSAYSEPFSC